MATYISLITFTEKGVTHVKDSTKRAEAFDSAAEANGVKIVGQYWTFGSYDGVLIVEAESEQKALGCLVDLAAAGNVKTESMRAFDASAFDEIVGAG